MQNFRWEQWLELEERLRFSVGRCVEFVQWLADFNASQQRAGRDTLDGADTMAEMLGTYAARLESARQYLTTPSAPRKKSSDPNGT